jgi:hypothetical protein
MIGGITQRTSTANRTRITNISDNGVIARRSITMVQRILLETDPEIDIEPESEDDDAPAIDPVFKPRSDD